MSDQNFGLEQKKVQSVQNPYKKKCEYKETYKNETDAQNFAWTHKILFADQVSVRTKMNSKDKSPYKWKKYVLRRVNRDLFYFLEKFFDR